MDDVRPLPDRGDRPQTIGGLARPKLSQGGARAASGSRGFGEQRKSQRLLLAGGGIMGSQTRLGTSGARNSSYAGARGQG